MADRQARQRAIDKASDKVRSGRSGFTRRATQQQPDHLSEQEVRERLEELRHSVAITILDALRWTKPSEVDEGAFAVLAEGLELFAAGASEKREEEWMASVLTSGWNLCPSKEECAALDAAYPKQSSEGSSE